MRIAQKFVKKLAFWMVVLLVLSGTLFWGFRTVLQIDSKYSAAISATRDVGIYAQRTASYAGRIEDARNAQVFEANQQMLRSLLRKMEMRHFSLMRGNPKLNPNDMLVNEIKAVYYAMPSNLANQVRDFLANAKVLSEMSFAEKGDHVMLFSELKQLANSSIVSAISHVIQVYETDCEARISKAVFVLVAVLLAMLILAIVAYLFIFDEPKPVLNQGYATARASSVSNVLGGLSVFPGKVEPRLDLDPEEELRSSGPVTR